jgi:cell wall-associated NlpC family hydrolase
MEKPLTSINEEVPVAANRTRIDRLLQRISLQILGVVIPAAIVYYAIPFLVDGYVYETRLKNFMTEIQALRDVVEIKLNEDKYQNVKTRLIEATQHFDSTLKWIEKKYSEKTSPTLVNAEEMENQATAVDQKPMDLLEFSARPKQMPEAMPSENQYTIHLQNIDGEDIVWAGKRWIGTPYSWGGGAMWDGTDCSGFTHRVYKTFGIALPRTAREQFNTGSYVSRKYLQPGDLVFFTTIRPGVSHVGMYAGDRRFIHASSGTGWVTISSLDEPYFAKRFVGARRIIG